MENNTHSKLVGYILWLVGFTGAHRFYFGKPASGLLYLCTFGCFGIGWFFDLFLINYLDEVCDERYEEGPYSFTLMWCLLTFGGIFGLHRMFQGKWISGILFALTGGFFLIGWAYDFCTLNSQISELNRISNSQASMKC